MTLNISEYEAQILDDVSTGKKLLIKRLPWLCGNCQTEVYTITWIPEYNCFKFDCDKCKESFWT